MSCTRSRRRHTFSDVENAVIKKKHIFEHRRSSRRRRRIYRNAYILETMRYYTYHYNSLPRHTCELFKHTAHAAVHHYAYIIIYIYIYTVYTYTYGVYLNSVRIPRTGLFTFMRLLFAHLSHYMGTCTIGTRIGR